MSCCGKMRQQFAQATSAAPTEPKVRPSGAQFTIRFEYIGHTGMTVFGPASGRRYRFDAPGAQLAVDPRDRPGMAQIPLLREVR
jgi:hypothetical protein